MWGHRGRQGRGGQGGRESELARRLPYCKDGKGEAGAKEEAKGRRRRRGAGLLGDCAREGDSLPSSGTQARGAQ